MKSIIIIKIFLKFFSPKAYFDGLTLPPQTIRPI